MKRWPIQDAKNRLGRVIELARKEGPQTITRHGEPMVMVVAVNEFNKPHTPMETPLEFFSRFKGAMRGLNRRKDLPRTIET